MADWHNITVPIAMTITATTALFNRSMPCGVLDKEVMTRQLQNGVIMQTYRLSLGELSSRVAVAA